jgi:hypothetical protein
MPNISQIYGTLMDTFDVFTRIPLVRQPNFSDHSSYDDYVMYKCNTHQPLLVYIVLWYVTCTFAVTSTFHGQRHTLHGVAHYPAIELYFYTK